MLLIWELWTQPTFFECILTRHQYCGDFPNSVTRCFLCCSMKIWSNWTPKHLKPKISQPKLHQIKHIGGVWAESKTVIECPIWQSFHGKTQETSCCEFQKITTIRMPSWDTFKEIWLCGWFIINQKALTVLGSYSTELRWKWKKVHLININRF